MRHLPFISMIAFLCVSISSIAQSTGGDSTSDTSPSPTLGAGNGPADAAVATKRNYGEVSAGTANSKATLSVAMDYAPPASSVLPAFGVLSVAVSAPLGTTNGNTTQVATLDGLADSTNVTFKAIGFWVQTANQPTENLKKFCGDLRKAVTQAEQDHRPNAKDLKECSTKLVKGAKGFDKASCGTGKETCCNSENAELLNCIGSLSRSEVDAYERGDWASPVTWAAGTSVTVGSKSYQYLLPATAVSTKETLIPWSAQIFAATQWKESLFTGGFRYQVAYKDANTGSLCPAPKSYPVDCKTGPIGPPPKTESPTPYLEYRQSFRAGFAIDPSINYDLKKSVVGISLPVYFIGSGSGKLTGGASVGWRSDQGGAQFGLFVGSAFSLSPQ
jgi:hypothetical protein